MSGITLLKIVLRFQGKVQIWAEKLPECLMTVRFILKRSLKYSVELVPKLKVEVERH